MKYHLIMNPGSRSFAGQKLWPEIFNLFNKNGLKYEYSLTKKMGDGISLTIDAIKNGAEIIVAVGGDGTINEVINGVHASKKKEIIFGVIYTGTSPDFCNWLGIPIDTETAFKNIHELKLREIDLCSIVYREKNKRVERVFACSSNYGLGAAIARGSNTGLRKKFGDSIGTFLSMFSGIINYKPSDFKLRIDGEIIDFENVWNIFIGKNPYIASGIKLNIDIEPDDGKMYLMSLNGISKSELLMQLPKVYTGTLTEKFKPYYCEEIDILWGNENNEVEYDGDPRGILPARIKIIPKGLKLIG